MLWIKCTIPPEKETSSKLRGMHENADIDDLKNKFYEDSHFDKRGFAFGFGELSVCKIDHDGSDDDVKMCLETDVKLKDFLMPSEAKDQHKHGS